MVEANATTNLSEIIADFLGLRQPANICANQPAAQRTSRRCGALSMLPLSAPATHASLQEVSSSLRLPECYTQFRVSDEGSTPLQPRATHGLLLTLRLPQSVFARCLLLVHAVLLLASLAPHQIILDIIELFLALEARKSSMISRMI